MKTLIIAVTLVVVAYSATGALFKTIEVQKEHNKQIESAYEMLASN